MSTFPFSGLNLAITTPFDDCGRVDFDRFQQLIERYIAIGVDGLVLSSGTGMHVYLSTAESRALIERGVHIVGGRAKVIAQASALLPDEVIERTRFAKSVGADGVMVLPPFFEGPVDDDSIVNFYADVAKVGLPIIGYNVPHAVGVKITPHLLRRLGEIPEFKAVKDSSGDLVAQVTLIATGHAIINGADPLVPYSLFAGASGLIWGGANFAPRTCLAISKAAQQKRWNDVQILGQKLEPIMSLLWEGDYVQSVYAAAKIMGYGCGDPRKPFTPLSAERVERIRSALSGLISEEAVE